MEEMSVPLFREVRYLGSVNVCTKNGFIFSYEKATYSMRLFNVMVSEEGYRKACELLLATPTIEIEIDDFAPTTQGMEVYAFVEGELLQQYLITHQLARIKLRNPEYEYYPQMMELETFEVSEEVEIEPKSREFNRENANKFIYSQLVLIIVVFLVLILRKIIKKVI